MNDIYKGVDFLDLPILIKNQKFTADKLGLSPVKPY